LQQEFSALNCNEIESWIRVSEPPPFGLELNKPQFQAAIGAALRTFKPDCVVLDPWNAAARDDKQKDYNETFDALRGLIPTGADRPALGVVAHTRKPQLNEKRIGGTCLQHLLAGSYVLSSRPRSIFLMVPGSDDETDNSVVFLITTAKRLRAQPGTEWAMDSSWQKISIGRNSTSRQMNEQ
jgi:hypothetical protein